MLLLKTSCSLSRNTSSGSPDSSTVIESMTSSKSLTMLSYTLSPNIPSASPITCSCGMTTSPFSSRLRLSAVSSWMPSSLLGALKGSIFCSTSSTSAGARNTLPMFWKRKSLMKPRRTTSCERILRGMESTRSASSSIISPFSSSPMTGKKFRSVRTRCLRSSVVPPPEAVSV